MRYGRYQAADFISTVEEIVEQHEGEVMVSEVHDISIAIEDYPQEPKEELERYILEVSQKIPYFDDMTQKYDAHLTKGDEEEKDFPHSLAYIMLERDGVELVYWSEGVNNEFTISFSKVEGQWKLTLFNSLDMSHLSVE